jgi:Tol biopolymer transport system component
VSQRLPDVWAVPLFGDRHPIPVAQTAATENGGVFSPDGQWVAYDSTETGRSEVYVQAFPAGGDRHQVSQNGGIQPTWSRDGREIYFLSVNNRLMTAPVSVANGNFESFTPQTLFAVTTPTYSAACFACTPSHGTGNESS